MIKHHNQVSRSCVAVIDAMSNSGGTEGVTSDFKIYDGDEPKLPMWMDFRC